MFIIGHQAAVENSALHYYPLVNGNLSTLLSIHHNESLPNSIYYLLQDLRYILSSYYYATLSVNGTTLSSNPRKFNLSYTITRSKLTKEMNYQYNTADEGFYDHLHYVYSQYVYYAQDYYFFLPSCLCYSGRFYSYVGHSLNIQYLSLQSSYFILRTYSKHQNYNIIYSSNVFYVIY